MLWDAGPLLVGAEGSSPLTNAELRYWQDNTGLELKPWQLSMIRRLSAEYWCEMRAARSPDRPAPFLASRDAPLLRQLVIERDMDTFLD